MSSFVHYLVNYSDLIYALLDIQIMILEQEAKRQGYYLYNRYEEKT